MHNLLAVQLSALTLLVLPGAWLAFGLPLQPISFTARLALAGAASPFVVALQFYILRFLGASFELTATVILVVNLAGAWLIVRRRKELHFSWGQCAGFAGVFLVLAGGVLIPWATTDSYRLYHSHQWLQSGVVYQFSEGRMIPEEPELAGVRLRYPWMGHIDWAVLSWTMDVSPTRTYVLTNVFSLLWICILIYETCRARGAQPFAGLCALLWVALGTGAVNFYIWKLFGGSLHGDERYVPWLRKFTTFELSPFALAMFAAIILLGVLTMQERSGARLALIAILLWGIGLVYPVVFPGAAGFCGVLSLLLVKEAWPSSDQRERQLAFGFLAALIVVGLLSLAYVRWLTGSRSTGLAFFSPPTSILAKSGSGLLALAPLWFGAALLGLNKLKEKENLLLLGGAIPSFLCYVLLQVTLGYNEYKFMFGLAMCLAPVACLALERWPSRIPASVAVVASAVIFFPLIFAKALPVEQSQFEHYPKVEDRSYRFRLTAIEPDRNWSDAVRDATPRDTVLSIRATNLFLPALTERSLLGPPEKTESWPGHWMTTEHNLVEERGYPPQLVQERENLVRRIFACGQGCNPEAIAAELDTLHRPVALVFYPGEGTPFRAWLEQQHMGESIYSGAGPAVWLYKPHDKLNTPSR